MPPGSSNTPTFGRGAILRIRLRNFMAYNDVEFFPGPRLNLILGPNGSGKSSVISAMCIGLDGSPSTLGRSDELDNLIRAGSQSAFIEIELASGSPNQENTVIKRIITRKRSSQWYLNNERVSHGIIQQHLKDLNIQVDNLTQFLPQDRVAKFATMSPQEMLIATENAIGGKDLFDQHQRLIQYRDQFNSLKAAQDERTSIIQQLSSKISNQQAQLDRHENLKKLKYRKLIAIKKLPYLSYKLGKRIEISQMEQIVNLKSKIHDFEKIHILPLSKQYKSMEAIYSQDQPKWKQIRHSLRSISQIISSRKAKIPGLEVQLSTLRVKISQVESDLEAKQTMLESKKNDLKELETIIESLDNPETITPLIEKCKMTKMELEGQKKAITSQIVEIHTKIRTTKHEIDHLSTEKHNLQNLTNRRITALSKYSNSGGRLFYDIPNALNHEKQKGSFTGTVYGPIGIDIQIVKPQFATTLDNLMSDSVRKILCCSDTQGLSLLSQMFGRQCPIHIVHSLDPDLALLEKSRRTGLSVDMNNLPPANRPIPLSQIAKYGIECYVDQIFSANPYIVQCLRNSNNYHYIPVAKNGELDTFAKVEKLFEQFPRIRRVCTSTGTWVKRSNRGASAVSFEKFRHKSGPFTESAGGDDPQNNAQMHKISIQIENKSKTMSLLTQKRDEIRDVQLGSLNSKINDCISEIRRHKTSIQKYESQAQYIQKAKLEIAQEEQQIKTADATKTKRLYSQKIKKIQVDIININRQLVKYLENAAVLLSQHSQYVWKNHQFQLGMSTLIKERERFGNQLTQARLKLSQLEKALYQQKKQIEQEKNRLEAMSINPDDPCPPNDPAHEQWNQLPDDMQNLQKEIFHLSNSISTLDGFANHSGLADSKQKNIQSLKELLVEQNSKIGLMTQLTSTIKQETNQWLNTLGKIIKRVRRYFSRAFASMNCSGTVQLIADDPIDFSSYGLDIQVSFRDGKGLASLSSLRLSGGERSVTTMVYLIAMQTTAETFCPFRVVDEINQGMDETNERLIFDLMIESISQSAKAPQYFMASPKLLSFLNLSSKDIRVHIVFNGSFAYVYDKSVKKKKVFINENGKPTQVPLPKQLLS